MLWLKWHSSLSNGHIGNKKKLGVLGCEFDTTKPWGIILFSNRLVKYSKLNSVRNDAFANLYYNFIKYICIEKIKSEIVISMKPIGICAILSSPSSWKVYDTN